MTIETTGLNKSTGAIPAHKIDECIHVLKQLLSDNELLSGLNAEQKINLYKAAGSLAHPSREEKKERRKKDKKILQALKVERGRMSRAKTGIRRAREVEVFTAPKQIDSGEIRVEVLESPRNCYVCNKEFTELHHFYDTMCPECAHFNYQKRFQNADLTGQVALITGSRLKIGYQASVMMLRSGARVIATTRFPIDSAIRFAKEEDFPVWKDRLHIYGLDLRHTPSVELFAAMIENTYERLDILINNAAQTVRRPPGFYAHLMATERLPFDRLSKDAQFLLSHFESCKHRLFYKESEYKSDSDLPVKLSWQGQTPGMGLCASAELSQIPYSFDNSLEEKEFFPDGKLDADLQQVDLRKTNSWRYRIGEVSTPEMLEVQLVNAVAPFVLCNRLSNMMRRDPTFKKHIVNVTAMEGKFYRFMKDDRHPHTNMAKAALNMLTHTSASTLAKDGIYMNAVDTGWVTDEDPIELSLQKQKYHDFQPPLDIVDGAARVMDPVFDGINTGKHWCGKFLKDYFPIDW